LEQFPPGLDLDYAILSREDPLTGELSALLVSPGAVIAEPGSDADLALKSRDRIMLFGQDLPREGQLEPLLVELRSQRSFDNPAKLVEIRGSVKFPGAYPLTDSMDIKQIIKASGGLTESAYMGSVEITREDLSDAELANVEIKIANLTELLSESAGSLSLQANDLVTIKVLPDYRERESVTLEGEVLFPGVYVISRGETLVQVINRAGGFTEHADIGAAFFTREALRVKEAQNLLELKERMEQQLSAEQLNDTENPLDANVLARQKETLSKLADTKAIGRLVIPLKAILDQRENDITLTSGDKLIIPQFRQEVTILGEVQRSASHLFRRNSKLKDYLEMSGGFTEAADKRGVYLIKSSGEVVIPRSGLFKFKSKLDKVEPGDTIVVPVDTNGPVKVIPLMAEVSRMIYELALGAAAINSFSSP